MNPIGFVLPAASLGLGALLFKPQRGFFKAGTKTALIEVPHAVIEERHSHRLQITEHPVETGSVIADHAFMLPKSVVVRCLWSNSPPTTRGGLLGAAGLAAAQFAGAKIGTAVGLALAAGGTVTAVSSILSGNAPQQARDTFQKLIDLQESRVPFDLYTGKKAYANMLIQDLGVETNVLFENSLAIVATCHEVLFATPSAINVPINVQSLKDPQLNSPTTDGGARNLTPAPNFVTPP